MSEGSDTAHGGPVSNTGLVATNLTPASSVPLTGVAPQLPHPVPLLSTPSHSNGHGPTTTPQGVKVSTSISGDPNNLQPKIPPLMGIRTDTFPTTLPPPPPVQLPNTVASRGTSQITTGEMSWQTRDGAPRLEELPPSQRRGQELDHQEESDGEEGKGEGESISQEDLA